MADDEYERMPADALTDLSSASATPEPTRKPSAAVLDARKPGLTRARLAGWLDARAMFVIAVAAVFILSLLGIPAHLSQDGWLALIAGRLIAGHGIPHHDYFALMTHGVRWVDQQWLAQLLMYEVQRVGGLQLLTALYVLVTAVAFAGAIAAARDLGAEDLHVLMAALPGAYFYLVTAVSIRTQGLAYPLFVATLWLLASEVRSPIPRRRVYLVFPMLVLWGNLHGSVTLGAGLAALYGLLMIGSRVRQDGWRGVADARAWAFLVISPLALLATPYGLSMVHYYRVTLLNSQFSSIVTEWQPVTTIPILAVPLFALIVLIAAVVGRMLLRARSGSAGASDRSDRASLRPALFDVLALAVLALGAIMAVRNVTWFGLALMVLLPSLLTRLKAGRPAPLRRSRVNARFAAGTCLLAALVLLLVLTRPTSWFTSTYPKNAIPILRSLVARDPQAKILADVRFADWLIWEDPRLFSGRVAYDTSFELLTRSQLSAIADLAAKTKNARGVVDAYRIWMLYPVNHSENRTLLRRPNVHLISRSHRVIIAIHGSIARPVRLSG